MAERINYRPGRKRRKKIDQDAKLKGYDSLNEYINTCIDHFLKCEKVKPQKRMNLVRLPPDTECSICHKIPEFPWAYEWEGEYHCLDCDAKKYGSESTAKLALKERKQKYILKVVKEEVERMLDIYEELDFVGHASAVLEKDKKANESIMTVTQRLSQFLTELGAMGYEKERQNFENLMRHLEDSVRDREDIRTVLNRALDILNKLLVTKKKRKKAKPIVT